MDSDITFFTNKEPQSLADRFRSIFTNVKYFDILVGYFRSSGFFRLYKDMENIEKIRILVGLNVDNKTVNVLTACKQGEIDFESHSKTKEKARELIRLELENSDDSSEVEIGVREFVRFIKSGKLELRAHPSHNIHAKVYISRFDESFMDYGRVITGSSNFSVGGLVSQYEFNVELKDKADVLYAEKRFNELWAESVDISQEYVKAIEDESWLDNKITPYEIYLKFLYESLEKRLETNDDLNITYPDGFMELSYQKQAVHTLRDIVDKYNGAFVSDVVGLGKTYISAMYAQGLSGKKLFICPPPIIDSWKNAIDDFGVRSATVESIGKLSHIIRSGYKKYDYIFVDEAHRFRNENTVQYKQLHQICFGKKVILITATPLNNSVYDFLPLIKLFQPQIRNSNIEGMPNVEAFFIKARQKLKGYDKNDREYIEAVKSISKEIRDKILKYIMIRRTRTDIREYFKKDLERQNLKFPTVETPKQIIYQFNEQTNKVFEDTILAIKKFKYARYKPKSYLNEELSEFEKTQETNLVGFMKTRLVKRLESSRYAFLQTISRFISSYELFIDMYESGKVYLSSKVNVYEHLDDEDDVALLKALEKDKNSEIFNSTDFNESFVKDLKKDLKSLRKIKEDWASISEDTKKKSFVDALRKDPILKGNKLLIFTESTETGEDLYSALSGEYGSKVLFFSSGKCKYAGETISNFAAKEKILENYDPRNSTQSDEIKILITTDVLAEGINLHRSNVIVNYDLPWNPTRVLQRVGRINRVGTKFDKIYIYNFFPAKAANDQIKLKEFVIAKICAFHATLGEDAKYLCDEEETENHNLFGEKLYDDLNNSKIFDEDDFFDNSELKYLNILKEIQKNKPELFNRIKNLPNKIRTARYGKVNKASLLTFFKQGMFVKTFLTDGKTTKDLVFDEAVKLFECAENAPTLPVGDDYFELLKSNKDFFANQIAENANPTGSANPQVKKVVSLLKFALKCPRYTKTQEKYIKRVQWLFENGSLPNDITKNIIEEFQSSGDSANFDEEAFYKALRNSIPPCYTETELEKENASANDCRVILSEKLIPESR